MCGEVRLLHCWQHTGDRRPCIGRMVGSVHATCVVWWTGGVRGEALKLLLAQQRTNLQLVRLHA